MSRLLRATRDDFTFTTSNKQLNFLQHIYRSLKVDGKARAAVAPDFFSLAFFSKRPSYRLPSPSSRAENQSSPSMVVMIFSRFFVLRDDGITYHQYVTELTYILFLKMAKETGAESQIVRPHRIQSHSAQILPSDIFPFW